MFVFLIYNEVLLPIEMPLWVKL